MSRFALFAVAGVIALGCPVAPAGAQEVAARPAPGQIGLARGMVLFDFEQGLAFDALGRLQVEQHFGRLGSRAELLRGRLLLALGLDREAQAALAAAAEDGMPQSETDRAWLALAQARLRRGAIQAAEEALAPIRGPLPAELQIERQLLQARLLMARQDVAGAAALLTSVQGDSTAARFARYNAAATLMQTGRRADHDRALALLDALGRDGGGDEEQQRLRDRANLALGQAALQEDRPREARSALQRVRLGGELANPALLAYGWAAAALNDPRLALVPWSELAGRPVADAAVHEAQLAVPYALSEAGAYAGALAGYQEAEASFATEQRALGALAAEARAGRLVDRLLQAIPDDGRWGFENLPPGPTLQDLVRLAPLLADDPFHEGLRRLRDLRFLVGQMQSALLDLATEEDLLEQRRRDFALRLTPASVQDNAASLAALGMGRAALAAELANAEREGNAQAFASPQEAALLALVAHIRAALGRAVEDPTTDAAQRAEFDGMQERLRRAGGALQWRLAQQLPQRLRTAHEALSASEAALAEARARQAALAAARQTEPAKQQQFAERILSLRQGLQTLMPQLQALATEQRQALQAMVLAELQRQDERLKVYAEQARLGMAQVLNSALFARRPDAGGAP